MTGGLAQATEPRTRRGFASRLWRLAELTQAAESRRSFRAKAYRTAVWALDDLADLNATDEELQATPGIGPGVTALVQEYLETGELNQLIPLEEAYPLDSPRLRRLPRMTPKMLHELKSGLGVETTADLLEAIDSGAAETVRGAGRLTVETWRRILDLAPGPGFFPSHQAWVTASALAKHFADHTGCWVDLAGQVRRMDEWVDRIDMVALTEDNHRLVEFVSTTAVLEETDVGEDVLHGVSHSGIPVVVHPAAPEASGTKLVWTTGPLEHARLVTAEPYPTEHEAYRSAGLPLIPPPARGLPIEDALRVVGAEDIKGDLHLHSNYSPDGRMTLREIVVAAEDRGYDYLAITDHTRGLRFGGLDDIGIAAQAAVVADLRSMHPAITIFHGAELNIGRDGTLDLSDETLDLLDFAVAGVHSYFAIDRSEQTARIIEALKHPMVRILAHPFGRRIGIRPPLDVDMDAVIDVAITHGVALETNGHRDRLDLNAEWIGRASAQGAVFAANSDAHRAEEIGNIENAVATLQKAGVRPPEVINTFPTSEMTTWTS